jgi:hypothetical protein
MENRTFRAIVVLAALLLLAGAVAAGGYDAHGGSADRSAEHYQVFADFAVYFTGLLALSLLITGSRMELRKSLAFSLGTAAILAFALKEALAGASAHLDTMPVGISLLFIAALGILWFFAARRVFNTSRALALSIGYSSAYGCALVALPSLLGALTHHALFLSVTLLLAFPAAIACSLLLGASHRWNAGGKDGETAALSAEEQTAAQQSYRDSATILAGLEQLERIIKSTPKPAEALVLIRPTANWLAHSRREAERSLAQLREYGRSLEGLDSARYAALHQRLAHLPRLAQAEARRELGRVRQRLRLDENERRLTEQVAANTAGFSEAVARVVQALEKGHRGRALRHARGAQRLEAEAQKLSAAITATTTHYQQAAARILTRAALSPEALHA